jgi:four helix bundle protein
VFRSLTRGSRSHPSRQAVIANGPPPVTPGDRARSNRVGPTGTGDEPTVPVLTDAERLDVYRVALEAHGHVAALPLDGHRIPRDQLERSSLSIVLNIAEGAGRRSRRHKRRHYAIAQGSAMECAAGLAVVRLRGLANTDEVERARRLVVRVIQMLSKLDRALA